MRASGSVLAASLPSQLTNLMAARTRRGCIEAIKWGVQGFGQRHATAKRQQENKRLPDHLRRG